MTGLLMRLMPCQTALPHLSFVLVLQLSLDSLLSLQSLNCVASDISVALQFSFQGDVGFIGAVTLC